MEKEKKTEISRDEDYSVTPSRRANVIAYVICVLAAIVIWLVIMNLNEPVNIPLGASAGEGILAESMEMVL